MGKAILGAILMIALVVSVRTCEKSSDGDKAKTRACDYFIQKYPSNQADQIRKIVDRNHKSCLDKCYTLGSRRKDGELDYAAYQNLLNERITKELGPAPPKR